MTLQTRLGAIRARMAQACARAERPVDSVRLIAVTKGHPADTIRDCLREGLTDFGESYVAEWEQKHAALAAEAPQIHWHFIGHLQSRKVRVVASAIHTLHSLDRPSLVHELQARRDATAPLDALVQVNIAGESQKFGCEPADAAGLVDLCLRTPQLRPVGLMAMAPYSDDERLVRASFRGLRELHDRIRDGLPSPAADRFVELSMGMSGDLEWAIEEGATWVRVGTALVGSRPPAPPPRK